ncbi:HTH-type quorum sensing-dependent transcriptional regulator RpaR [Methylophilaceae bacterium]|nr:HTH-type quorum sensing-dependent transcriptional regulator RpaR [Methylophilaceae bacterium]
MALNTELNNMQMKQFVGLLHQSLKIRSRCEFLLWSQGEVQQFIPHDIMIAAWGDFSQGEFNFDIVSALPGMHADHIRHGEIKPFLTRMFEYWKDHLESPFIIKMDEGILGKGKINAFNLKSHFIGLKSALVHAIKDIRGRHDCLYVLLSASNIQPTFSRTMLEAFLPYIDHSLRQFDHLHETLDETGIATGNAAAPLSAREMEIMEWVMNGKTNFEIGMILNISVFTVKNHLQRIFRKLDVISRAQAVAKLSKFPEKNATH